MVSMDAKSPVHSVMLSSVVPAKATGDNIVQELTNMDLAMKLHYLRGVYFFRNDAVEGLTIYDLKKPMFPWLQLYNSASGRIRRSDDGRPFIKCNDSGVRILEAQCDALLDDFLVAMTEKGGDHGQLLDPLVHRQVLGPDLAFSPLVYIQFTWFKCGGISVGLSWAHVLGDAFSAASFINMWGQFMAGHAPPKSLHAPTPGSNARPELTKSGFNAASAIRKTDPVGDRWLAANNCKLETWSLHVTAQQVDLISTKWGMDHQSEFSQFELLAAMLWKSWSKVREDEAPRPVTICTNNVPREENHLPINCMILSTVEAKFPVAEAEITELARLISEKVDENGIDEIVEKDDGKTDFIAYGVNLTIVNLEGADIYGLKLKGKKPVYANYTMSGVGDEGVILVLPGPENGNDEEGGGAGKTVTMVLPHTHLAQLQMEIEKELGNSL